MQHSAEQPDESMGVSSTTMVIMRQTQRERLPNRGQKENNSLQVDHADGRFEYLGGKIPSVQQFVIAHKEFFK